MAQPASNILLCGVGASGKSATGRHLARILGYGFLDLDELIVRQAGKTIAQIFVEHGEDYFREMERQILHDLQRVQKHVLALGGGALISSENQRMVRNMGYLVWLNPPVNDIARRLVMKVAEIERRPVFAGIEKIENKMERLDALQKKITGLLGERLNGYSTAQLEFGAGYATAETVAVLLRQRLQSVEAISPTDQLMLFGKNS